MKIPSFILWCYNTPLGPFSGGIGTMQSSPHKVDVPYWMLPQNPKRICENKAKPERSMIEDYALEKALRFCIRFCSHKSKSLGWEKYACMNDEVVQGNGHAQIMSADFRDMAHSFVPQNVDLMSTWCM
jgi:hypothetical protein